MIRRNAVCYIGLDALTDSAMARAIGTLSWRIWLLQRVRGTTLKRHQLLSLFSLMRRRS